MSDIFIKAINMSISAGWIVLAIFFLRLVLKRAPKWVIVLMWSIVGIRLICPYSIESVFSLIPSATTVSPEIMLERNPHINSGIPIINNAVNPVISSSFEPDPIASANPLQILIPVMSIVWVTGIAAMLIYSIISYIIIKNRVVTAIKYCDNIFQCETVVSPFVLGIFKPKIYLPFDISDKNIEYVIAHENAHIMRKDHLWKPIGFLLLSIYWFNPLIWFAYILLCRDIELACDEKVVKSFDNIQKADYSQALLVCSVNRKLISACPLAFGEVGVKSRIKSVLNYKKPAFWVIIVSFLLSIVLAICFLTNPKSNTLSNIENHSYFFIPEKTTTIFSSDGENYNSLSSYSKELLQQLIDLKISDNEVSLNRGEDRDKTNTLVIQTENDAELTKYSYIKGTYIHFNADFTEVWVYDQVKPTLSYRVLEPQKARNIYNNIINYSKFSFAQNIQTHSDFDPVYFSLESVTYDKDNNLVLDVIWRNVSENEVMIGEVYSIEYKESEEWLDIAFDEKVFHMIGYLLRPKDEIRKSYSLKDYDLSKSGRYRLIAPFSIHNSDEKYNAWIEFDVNNTSVGGADSSNVTTNIVSTEEFEQLKIKYPMYFGLDTSNGLDVYITQMSESSYYCALFPTKEEGYSKDDLWKIHKNFASIEEMKKIVLSYILNMNENNIRIVPVQMPYSSYYYIIDENYKQQLSTLFWSDFPVMQASSYSPIIESATIIDSTTFDIDNDGIDEYCQLSYGPTSGLFTFVFTVYQDGKPEYMNTFSSLYTSLKFEKIDNTTVISCQTEDSNDCFEFYVKDGNIFIESDKHSFSYWGEQGINSSIAD